MAIAKMSCVPKRRVKSCSTARRLPSVIIFDAVALHRRGHPKAAQPPASTEGEPPLAGQSSAPSARSHDNRAPEKAQRLPWPQNDKNSRSWGLDTSASVCVQQYFHCAKCCASGGSLPGKFALCLQSKCWYNLVTSGSTLGFSQKFSVSARPQPNFWLGLSQHAWHHTPCCDWEQRSIHNASKTDLCPRAK